MSALCNTQAITFSGQQQFCPPEQSDPTSQVSLSKPAELIQKLAALKDSDLTSFKKVANKVAEHFGQLAGIATGFASRSLSEIASRFANAAENGDLSGIIPGVSGAPAAAAAPAPEPAPTPSAPEPVDPTAIAFSMVNSMSFTSSDPSAHAVDKLTELKSTDQAKFKKVMNGVAEHLERLGNLADGADRENLTKLAATFASSADSGDLSALEALKPAAPEAPVVTPPAAPAPTPVDTLGAASALIESLTASTNQNSGNALDRLTALKSSDQATFKKVMNGVAEQLESMGNLAGGSDGQSLGQLAAAFAGAADSGDLSALSGLKPPAVEAPTPPPPPPAAPAPVDAMASAMSMVDTLTSASGLSGSGFDKLSTLKTTDQASFKKVMNGVAEQLEQMANLTSSSSDREALSGLAATFASGAQNGDISALAPAPVVAPPAPPPPAAPAPTPIDAVATALSMVDTLTPSGSGSALQKLTTLKTTDQAQFKSVMNNVAVQLEQMGNLAEGEDRDNLVRLAATFASGADNGDLSALQPPAPPAPPPTESAPTSGSSGWNCGYAMNAYAQASSPRQTMDEAFSSALNLVSSLTGVAA